MHYGPEWLAVKQVVLMRTFCCPCQFSTTFVCYTLHSMYGWLIKQIFYLIFVADWSGIFLANFYLLFFYISLKLRSAQLIIWTPEVSGAKGAKVCIHLTLTLLKVSKQDFFFFSGVTNEMHKSLYLLKNAYIFFHRWIQKFFCTSSGHIIN